MNAHFMQTWFRIDTKMMRNFVQKSHFVQKRETEAQQHLLFRGNPTQSQLRLRHIFWAQLCIIHIVCHSSKLQLPHKLTAILFTPNNV